MSLIHAAKKARVLGCLALALPLLVSVPCFSDSMKDTANAYFAVLKKDFDKLAANKAIRNPHTGPVNVLFTVSLKKHLPISYLAKANTKGIIVNEVARGEKPKKKVHRKTGNAEWYSFVIKNKKAFSGISEENGRNYLTWSKPLLGAKKRSAGVVVEKIDLSDCFHMLSKETTAPYLVRLQQKSLYSYKWENDSSYLEEPMTIPGIEKITILTEKPVAASHAAETLDVSVQRVNAVPAAPTQVTPEKPEKAKKAPVKISKKRVLIIIIGIIVVLLLIIFLFRFYIWLNHKFLMHSINKSD
jgi:hypothetical protein